MKRRIGLGIHQKRRQHLGGKPKETTGVTGKHMLSSRELQHDSGEQEFFRMTSYVK